MSKRIRIKSTLRKIFAYCMVVVFMSVTLTTSYVDAQEYYDSTLEARLTDLSMDPIGLSETFDPDKYSYTSTVDYEISTITISASADEGVAITGDVGEVSLEVGVNSFTVVASKAEEVTSYSISIFREKPQAEISDLNIFERTRNGIQLDPLVNVILDPSEVGNEVYVYNGKVDYTVEEVKIEPVLEDATFSGDIGLLPVSVGNNEFNFTVNKPHYNDSYYTVNIEREDKPALSNIILSEGTIEPDFSSEIRYYNVVVAYEIESIVINATAESGTSVGGELGERTLEIGENNFIVTASKNDVVTEYSITIDRENDNPAELTDFRVYKNKSEGIPLNPSVLIELNPAIVTDGIYYYTGEVEFDIDEIEIIPLLDGATISGDTGIREVNVGENEFNFIVSKDGFSSTNYTLVINRAEEFKDVELDNLYISYGNLNESFEGSNYSYTASVPYEVTNVSIMADLKGANITGDTGNRSLEVGANVFTVTVSKPGYNTMEYTITVTRKEPYANLTDLTVSNGKLEPSFDSTVYEYTVYVNNETEDIEINATLESSTIEGDTGSNPLELGKNLFTINVTKENHQNTEYNIVVYRSEYSKDVELTSLYIDEGELSPVFIGSIYSYDAVVDNSVEEITIDAELEGAIISGDIGKHTLSPGENSFVITVEKEGFNSRSYTIDVYRTKLDVNLSKLILDNGTLEPSLTEGIYSYLVIVPYESSTLNISPILEGATFTGETGVRQLTEDAKEPDGQTFVFNVNHPDYNSKSYEITVVKVEPAAQLEALSVSQGSLNPQFESSRYSYTVPVNNNIEEIDIYAQLIGGNITISKYGTGDVESGTDNVSLTNATLDIGSNHFTIYVSKDSYSVKEYTIEVIRESDNVIELIDLTIGNGVLTPSFESNIYSYTSTVAHEDNIINIIPTVPIGANITGQYGTRSLKVGSNTFDITVSKPGYNSSKYSIEVFREYPDVELDNLEIINKDNGAPIILSPVFSGDTYLYSANVGSHIRGAEINAYLANSNITGDIGNRELFLGSNVYEITVSKEKYTTKQYAVTIYRDYFNAIMSVAGNKEVDEKFDIVITDAKDYAGGTLNHLKGNVNLEGEHNVTITSNGEDGIVFNNIATFNNGNVNIPINLTTAQRHILTVEIESIQETKVIEVDIEPATPEIIWPTFEDITYGEELTESSLIGGMATNYGKTVEGTFSFEDTKDKLNAGLHNLSVVFTPDNTDNYSVVSGTVAAQVDKRVLSLSNFKAENREYDGTTIVTGTGFDDNRLAGDDLVFSYDVSDFKNKNAGENNTIFYSNIMIIGGDDKNNYKLEDTTGTAIAHITPRTLTLSNFAADNKVYDKTTSVTGTGFDDDRVVGDDLVFTYDVVRFENKDVENNKPINYTNILISGGADENNYILANDSGVAYANITPRPLDLSNFTADDKVYDGEVTAYGAGFDDNRLLGANLEFNFDAEFTDKNVGNNKLVNYNNIVISGGADQHSYKIAEYSGGTVEEVSGRAADVIVTMGTYEGGNASRIPLYIGYLQVNNDGEAITYGGYIYVDGTKVSIQPDGTGIVSEGPYMGLHIDVSAITEEPGHSPIILEDWNKSGPGETIVTVNETLGSVEFYGGRNARGPHNWEFYAFADYTEVLDLSWHYRWNHQWFHPSARAEIYVQGKSSNVVVNSDSRGWTTRTGEITLNLAEGDRYGVKLGANNFDSNRFMRGTFTLTDAIFDIIEREKTSEITGTANITPKSLALSNIIAENKVYDGDVNAMLRFDDNRITGDSLEFSYAAQFNDENVGDSKTVDYYNISISGGADQNNYQLESVSGSTTANITPRPLVLNNFMADDKVYDGTTSVTGTGFDDDRIPGDELELSYNTSEFENKDVGDNKIIEYLNIEISGGADQNNYELISSDGIATANITPRTLTLGNFTGDSKVYDGTTDVSGTGFDDDRLSGDILEFSYNADFENKDVAESKNVVYKDIEISGGADQNNYQLASTTGQATADISIRTLALSNFTADSKVYDGTTEVTGTGFDDDRVYGDDLEFSYEISGFEGKDVGTDKIIEYSNIIISGGADQNNYQLENTTGEVTADITVRPLTLSNFMADDKVYDRTTSVTGAGFDDDRIPGDELEFIYNVEFENSSIGRNKAVHYTDITISNGADKGNYVLANNTGVGYANITSRSQPRPQPQEQPQEEEKQVEQVELIDAVNGENVQIIGTTENTVEDGRVVTNMVITEINKSSESGRITVYTDSQADVVRTIIDGENIKKMEEQNIGLTVKNNNSSYSILAQQINISSVKEKIGEDVALKDIEISLKISKPREEVIETIQAAANKNNLDIIAQPIEFNVRASYKDRVIEISKFNNYVERTIEVPEDIDFGEITTAVVISSEGTIRHVPTKVGFVDGKYYAVINSLTNSAYSLIWNFVEYDDMKGHWAETDINDMGSRLIVQGVGDNRFKPNQHITRAEFATIIVRALGIAPSTEDNYFTDVSPTDWYAGYLNVAFEYGLIQGDGDKFRPLNQITREQAMVIIYRAMNITELNKNWDKEELENIFGTFYDSHLVSEWAIEGIKACLVTQIVVGSNNKIAPKDNITRAQAAVIIRRLLEKSNLI